MTGLGLDPQEPTEGLVCRPRGAGLAPPSPWGGPFPSSRRAGGGEGFPERWRRHDGWSGAGRARGRDRVREEPDGQGKGTPNAEMKGRNGDRCTITGDTAGQARAGVAIRLEAGASPAHQEKCAEPRSARPATPQPCGWRRQRPPRRKDTPWLPGDRVSLGGRCQGREDERAAKLPPLGGWPPTTSISRARARAREGGGGHGPDR